MEADLTLVNAEATIVLAVVKSFAAIALDSAEIALVTAVTVDVVVSLFFAMLSEI
ncbi:hypothetical protein FD04_GL000107 [Secundilactobacillus odoratitofui DSM 19909 = JCM 15043]|uniref:Uncharacterized protein n=1 Tax=Secundilactobacillus odoratitofui DSM 19909 = JCM 15043 TaxID=1423776 RepID=A0A0R1LTK1_9LACO|nr:hypothetical protein FD04_GL000107 [Secundilactobacillus odoratitofui DSM 19909 = JCM 15043]